MAFCTQELRGMEVDQRMFNQEHFERYWYTKCGFVYTNKSCETRVIKKSDKNASHWEVNRQIAAHHSLALYSGRIGELLTKIYPVTS